MWVIATVKEHVKNEQRLAHKGVGELPSDPVNVEELVGATEERILVGEE